MILTITKTLTTTVPTMITTTMTEMATLTPIKENCLDYWTANAHYNAKEDIYNVDNDEDEVMVTIRTTTAPTITYVKPVPVAAPTLDATTFRAYTTVTSPTATQPLRLPQNLELWRQAERFTTWSTSP